MDTDDMSKLMFDSSLWVFAYGSLLWKPSFHYHQKVVGHIKGCKRRFYQGNTNLRGSPLQPGRVAILVPDKEEVTWGVAYEVRGQQHVQHALEHLYVRENSNGGYHSMLTVFHPRPEQPQPACTDRDCQATSVDPILSLSQSRECRSEDVSAPSKPFSVLAFTATPASKLYLGPADVSSMARQVVAAHGQAGPNWEYVLRTAEYVRQHIPEDHDHHLLELEAVVRELMASRRQRHNSVHHDHAATSAVLTVPVPV